MKKILLACTAALLLASCGNGQSVQSDQSEQVTTGSPTYYSVSAYDYQAGGMKYKVFNSASGSLFVVNITKDSLEVEALKK